MSNVEALNWRQSGGYRSLGESRGLPMAQRYPVTRERYHKVCMASGVLNIGASLPGE
ncbi:MAG: hypothetical protein HQ518_06355 [Rhodopirellula sp.]|nr:hypothetical protein [Rhodopirellula sp.]